MFSSVSWGQYVMVVCVGVILWYAIIVLLYYHKRIKGMVMRPRLRAQPVAAAGEDETEQEEVQAPRKNTIQDPLQDVQTIIAEIKKVFAAVNAETTSQLLIFSLRQILTPYKDLKYSEFKSALNDYIQTQVSKTEIKAFTEEELNSLWNSD